MGQLVLGRLLEAGDPHARAGRGRGTRALMAPSLPAGVHALEHHQQPVATVGEEPLLELGQPSGERREGGRPFLLRELRTLEVVGIVVGEVELRVGSHPVAVGVHRGILPHPAAGPAGYLPLVPRVRLGVVIVVPEPVATEIEGLRRALGDPVLDRIMPHVHARAAGERPRRRPRRGAVRAASCRGHRSVDGVHAGAAAATFGPDSPVLYLPVEGGVRGGSTGSPGCGRLSWWRRCNATSTTTSSPTSRSPPSWRRPRLAAASRRWPTSPGRSSPIRSPCCASTVRPSRQAQRAGRRSPMPAWRAPSIVGRGGFELELTVSSLLDPDGAVARRRRTPTPTAPAALDADPSATCRPAPGRWS